MKPTLIIVSPANALTNNGNWHTAARWARFLSHDYAVKIVSQWSTTDELPEIMVALHARHSANSMAQFRTLRKSGGLILALTGTDVYRDIQRDAASQRSMRLADLMIVLQPMAICEIPEKLRVKCRVIFQSASALKPIFASASHSGVARYFDIVQVGHLRHEKDPFTPITALRTLPDESRIRLVQIGDTLDTHHAEAMSVVLRHEPRLRWLGALDHSATRQRIKRARVLVIASKMEGGANVIVEAVTSGVPVIASQVSGNIGMLGEDYPGYFPVGDAMACSALMQRTEADPKFLAKLKAVCAQRAKFFLPELERAGIRAAARATVVQPSTKQ